MTETQEQTLRAIYWFGREHGKSPVLMDLAREFRRSHVAIIYRLRQLERMGMISRVRREHRSIGITPKGLSAIGMGKTWWPFETVEERDEDSRQNASY